MPVVTSLAFKIIAFFPASKILSARMDINPPFTSNTFNVTFCECSRENDIVVVLVKGLGEIIIFLSQSCDNSATPVAVSGAIFTIQKSVAPQTFWVLSPLIPDDECPPRIYPPSEVCCRNRNSSKLTVPKSLSHCLLPSESVFIIQ